MYSYGIGCNVFLNVNTTRYEFYSKILEHSTKRTLIAYDELLYLGNQVGMSKTYIDDEIIGCLYANFLVPKSNNYQLFGITSRAMRDFSIYQSEAKNKTNEITLTIDFRKRDIKVSFFTMDTVPIEKILSLNQFGWTYNKSLCRCMCRCKDLGKLNRAIERLVSTFNSSLYEYVGSFSDVIKEYGHYRKRYKDYAANLNHRGLFACNSLLKYKEIYVNLKTLTKNPVDWGGDTFKKDLIRTLCSNCCMNADEFLIEAIDDGMIRAVNEYDFSITGHAAVIINSIINLNFKSRISIIIRKIDDKYFLLIGCNTMYEESFINELKSKGFQIEDDWYISKLQSNKEAILSLLNRVIEDFYNINEGSYQLLLTQ